MLPIRVRGHGMIPRIGRLAPMMTPMNCEYEVVDAIMSTPGMVVLFHDEATKSLVKITPENIKKVYNAYQKKVQAATNPKAAAKLVEEDTTVPVGSPDEKKPATPSGPPAMPHLVTFAEDGETVISTGVTLEEVVSGVVKAKLGWFIHKGGDVYEPVPEQYLEATKIEIPEEVKEAITENIPATLSQINDAIQTNDELPAGTDLDNVEPTGTLDAGDTDKSNAPEPKNDGDLHFQPIGGRDDDKPTTPPRQHNPNRHGNNKKNKRG